MRRILLLTLVVIGAMASSVLATVPHLINFQGFLRETVPPKNPANGTFDITFTIYDNLTGGSIIWAETQVGVVVDVGNFSVLLGSVTTLVDTVFNDTTRFLGIKVEADPEVAPRSRLVTMPYAFRSFLSETAVHADSATVSATAAFADSTDAITDGAVDMADIGQAGATSGQVLKWNGSAWGPATDDAGGASGWVDEGTVVRLETASDSVGIGTSSPSEKLDVVGNLVVSGKATIGPGNTNTGTNAFVAGSNNAARGIYSVVAGGGGAVSADSNSAIGDYSVVGGGRSNYASGFNSTVGGGQINAASQSWSTIGGGRGNSSNNQYATVGGGAFDTSSGLAATVSGGLANSASNDFSTVGGGRNNKARGKHSVVAGGGGSSIVDSNSAISDWCTVSGGKRNLARAQYATVGGGFINNAIAMAAMVGGGSQNTASSAGATVGGGDFNTASGSYATVPGGRHNTAMGSHSFAAGIHAKANHVGAIVIAANSSTSKLDSIRSGGTEQMVLRADGGLYLTNIAELAPYDASKIITTRGGAYLSGNGTTWTNASDKNQKENFTDVDSEELLEKISALPISRWNYKDEDETVTHVGPMAQDFYALFGVGADNKSISTIDPAGIALAAIKALYEKSKRIDALESELAELRSLVDELIANKK